MLPANNKVINGNATLANKLIVSVRRDVTKRSFLGHKSQGSQAQIRESMRSNSPKILIYSHDSFGLGHLRRCRAIAHSLVGTFDTLSVLILSGSPIIGSFEFRSRVDFVRIPGVIKLRDGEYTPLSLHLNIDHTPGDPLIDHRAHGGSVRTGHLHRPTRSRSAFVARFWEPWRRSRIPIRVWCWGCAMSWTTRKS